jgi:hypothetical protein
MAGPRWLPVVDYSSDSDQILQRSECRDVPGADMLVSLSQ